jgi:Ran-binding protein 3
VNQVESSAEESNPPDMPSKKRGASHQISKDDGPDLEHAVAVENGTFRKASDTVLANPRIVKVRHMATTVGGGGVDGGDGRTAAPNPFASIPVLPPVASSSDEGVAPQSQRAPGLTSDPSETIVALEKGDETEVSAKESDQPPTDANLEAENDAVAIEVSGGEKLGLGLEEQSKVLAKTGENGEVGLGNAIGPVGSSSETFQQLSSAKNAFSGSFGTGFSSSTFTFGSTQTSTGFSSFGSSSWSGLGFATGLAGSTSSTTAATAFPSLSSVFGNKNGNTTSFQLFGSQAAGTATPGFGAQNTGGLVLQEVPSQTGEEKEKPVFAADASLFEFLGGEWKERGRGEIRLNLPEDKDRRPRLVMRSKGNLRLLLNANLFPDMKLTKMDNRGVTFVCANSAGEAKVGLTTYAVRMKDSAMAADFLASVQIHKGEPNTEPRTPESSPKAVDRLVEGGSEQLSEDIETGVKRDTAEV